MIIRTLRTPLVGVFFKEITIKFQLDGSIFKKIPNKKKFIKIPNKIKFIPNI